MRPTLDTLAFEADAVTIVGEHDYPVRVHLIARDGVELERIEAVLSHPQPLPSARASCASSCRRPSCAQRQQHRRGGADGRASRRALGGARGAARRPSSTAASSCARGSRTRPTTSPASSGSRRRHRAPRGGGRLEDLAGLLRARRRPPGRAGRRAGEFSEPRDQPDPDRVAAAAAGPRPLHVLLRSRGAAEDEPPSPRRSRRCARRPSRCGSSAPIRSAESERLRAAERLRTILAATWHGSWYSTRRMSRSTSAR